MKQTPLQRKTPLRPKAALTTRTPLKARTPIKQKRDEPRVKRPDRTVQERTKPRAGSKSAAEKFHLGRVAGLTCCICGKAAPSTVHHVRRRPDRKGLHSRDHKRVVPLCPAHHLHDHGPDSVERIQESGMLKKFGINLWELGERLWEKTCGILVLQPEIEQ